MHLPSQCLDQFVNLVSGLLQATRQPLTQAYGMIERSGSRLAGIASS